MDRSTMSYFQPSHYPAMVMSHVAPLRPQNCELIFRQQPLEALVTAAGKEKARKPVDPPPIIQLVVDQRHDPHQEFLTSPFLFGTISLWKNEKNEPYDGSAQKSLTGSLTSSLHRLKDTNNKDAGFFIFGDISVKVTGTFRLCFSLYEFVNNSTEVHCLGTILSDSFNVVLPKDFKGMAESTYLSRAFSDQGVRLRLRKEPRGMISNKRSYPGDDESNETSRPNMHNEHPSSYDDASSPTKRFKNEIDDRKDSFPENINASINAYPTSYPNVSSYSSTQYAATQYTAPRQPSMQTHGGYTAPRQPSIHNPAGYTTAGQPSLPDPTGFNGLYMSDNMGSAQLGWH